MANYKLKPAVKYVKPMKMLFFGPQDSGKTLSSLYIAAGIVMEKRKCTLEESWKHIAMIDSEYGRGTLYAHIGPFNYFEIKAPYTCDKLIDLIHWLDAQLEIDVILPDSLTHYWTKSGGILDRKAAKDAKGGNSYTNWQEFSGEFSTLIDALLGSPKHILCTSRSKNDTVLLPNEKGKMVPTTMGLKADLRDGVDYDFDVVFNVEKQTHDLLKEKGVPGMPDVYAMATPETGVELYKLFSTDAVVPPRTPDNIMDSIRRLAKEHDKVQFMMLELSGKKLDVLNEKELIALEKKLIKEIKSGQLKKGKK